jgi:signal transduction histidine kinase
MLSFNTIFQPSYYYFNVCSLMPFIFFNITLFFAMFVLGVGTRQSFHRAIFYFYMSAALWFLGFALTLNAWVDPITFFWGRVTYLAVVLVPVTLLHLAMIVTGQYYEKRFFYQKRIFLWIAYLGVILLFIKTWSDPFFVSIEEYPWGFSPRAKDAHFIFLIYSFVCFTYALLLILRHYVTFLKLPQRRKADLQYRRKLQFVMVCFVLTLLSNSTILNNYGFGIYPFGPLLLFFSVVAMGYALVKYHNTSFLEQLRKIGGEVLEKDQEIYLTKKRMENARLRLVDAGKATIFASLSAGILHQICQPITAVHGLIKFIKKDMKETDPYYKSIDLIYEQSTYIKEMLNDLMDLMRHKETSKENVDVNVCMERSLRLLKDEFRIKRIEWDFIPGQHLFNVYADAIQLQQIFMNIMVNAVQALSRMPKTERRYVQIVTRYDAKADRIIASIENTGPGLSDEEKESIFEPFVSGGDGAGLGLALCKDLLYDHGGDMTVENIDDEACKGVKFIIRLPPSTF